MSKILVSVLNKKKFLNWQRLIACDRCIYEKRDLVDTLHELIPLLLENYEIQCTGMTERELLVRWLSDTQMLNQTPVKSNGLYSNRYFF